MSDEPPDPSTPNPFEGLPLFGDLANLFARQGPVGWDAARQLALAVATDGETEPNVDPVERISLEQLARVAELQVATATGLEPSPGGKALRFLPVNRTTWASRTLDDHRPYFELLAASLEPGDEQPEPPEGFAFLAPLFKMMGPLLLGLTAGSMVGHLARRSFGQYDLPVPRPAGNDLLVCVPNLTAFGDDWSIPRDDLRLWVCLHEVTHHAVLGVPHVRARLDGLLRRHLEAFEPDPGRLERQLGGFEDLDLSGPEAFQDLLSDPEVVLGAIRSPAQEALQPELDALVAAIVGYVDWIMDDVGQGLVTNYGMLTEAARRRRVEAAPADRFVERLFGLELTQATYDRGSAFAAGVVERAGPPGLARLWADERHLPTPAELDAPGLWLARIELPDD